jgi:hypothetical protein
MFVYNSRFYPSNHPSSSFHQSIHFQVFLKPPHPSFLSTSPIFFYQAGPEHLPQPTIQKMQTKFTLAAVVAIISALCVAVEGAGKSHSFYRSIHP